MEEQKPVLGRVALIITTLIWGSSFVILKETLNTLLPIWILAIRFVGATIMMMLIANKNLRNLDKHYIKFGAMMGLCLYFAYVLQTYGLNYTTPGKNAFLTAIYCVIVPFLMWGIYKKKPDGYNVMAAFICLVGMGFVSLDGDLSIGIGDGLTICCGFFYALHMVVTAHGAEGRDPVLLSMVQFFVAGALCLATAPMTGEFPSYVPASVWWSMAYLCIMCTGVCLLLQTIGQKHTSPQSASILLTLESVFGVIISIMFYNEQVSLKVFTGFVLIFIAIIISETKLEFLKKKKTEKLNLSV